MYLNINNTLKYIFLFHLEPDDNKYGPDLDQAELLILTDRCVTGLLGVAFQLFTNPQSRVS